MRVARACHANAERRFDHLINTWRPSQSSALLPMHENDFGADSRGDNIVWDVAEGIRHSSILSVVQRIAPCRSLVHECLQWYKRK